MKTWFEFPESTRFARTGGGADILYTPIYFANEEGISAKFCFDGDWRNVYDTDEKFCRLEARARLIGKASLGFLSIGGRPAHGGMDARYALPSVGFKPIYTLTVVEMSTRIRLEDAVDDRVPFQFRLPSSTLAELQQVASSLKIVTADADTTLDIFKEVSPALIVSVQYALVGEVSYEGERKSEHDSEIRVFVSLDQSQVPVTNPNVMGYNPLVELLPTGIVNLGRTRVAASGSRRRDSLPIIRRLSRSSSTLSGERTNSSVQEDAYLVVQAMSAEPFVFRTRDEAAAAKFIVTLTYHEASSVLEDESDVSVDDPPPSISANVLAMLKSHTSLTLEPVPADDQPRDQVLEDEFFHLRSKILPGKKTRLSFGKWEKKRLSSAMPSTSSGDSHERRTYSEAGPRRPRADTLPVSPTQEDLNDDVVDGSGRGRAHQTGRASHAPTLPTNTTAPPTPPPDQPSPPSMSVAAPPERWTTSADLWLTHPLSSTLTPSFTTPYINHMYTLSLSLTLVPEGSTSSKSKMFKSLKPNFGSSKSTIELTVPVQVRYDRGLVPSYEVDSSLPEYDFSLPGYEDAVGWNAGALPDETNLGPSDVEQRRRVGEGARRSRMEGDAAYEARISASHSAATDAEGARRTTSSVGTTRASHRRPHVDHDGTGRVAPSARGLHEVDDGDDGDDGDDVLQLLMREARL